MAGALNLLRLRCCCHTLSLLLFHLCLIVSVTSQSTLNSSSTLALNSFINATTTLKSSGGIFKLGFISGVQSNQTVYALAIWYVQTPTPKTVVWVADRSMALQNLTTASLSLSPAGDLEVHSVNSSYSSPQLVWSSKTTTVRTLHLHHVIKTYFASLTLMNLANIAVEGGECHD
jgi:hypothetical protein